MKTLGKLILLVLLTQASCKSKTTWHGLDGTGVRCGSFDAQETATCIGDNRLVYTCVRQRRHALANEDIYCAPRTQPMPAELPR